MHSVTKRERGLAGLTKEARSTFASIRDSCGRLSLHDMPGQAYYQVRRDNEYIGRLFPDGTFIPKKDGQKRGWRQDRSVYTADGKHWTTDRDLIKAHRDGLSYYEAAELLGVTYATVASRWRKLGLSPNKVRSPLPDEVFEHAHTSGLSSVSAGRELDRHPSVVLRRWQKLGLHAGQEGNFTIWRPAEKVYEELGLEPETRSERLERLRAEKLERIGISIRTDSP